MNTTLSNTTAAQPWNRFLTCAEAYGAQRMAWPDADRVLYDQFAMTVAGQQALQDARALDLMLTDPADYTIAAPDFLNRLQTMPLPLQARRPQSYVVVMWKRSALLLILMAALGFGNGYANTRDLNRMENRTMTTAFGVGF